MRLVYKICSAGCFFSFLFLTLNQYTSIKRLNGVKITIAEKTAAKAKKTNFVQSVSDIETLSEVQIPEDSDILSGVKLPGGVKITKIVNLASGSEALTDNADTTVERLVHVTKSSNVVTLNLVTISTGDVVIVNREKNNTINKPKLILVWNDLFGRNNWGFRRHTNQDFIDQNCKVTNCIVTDDKKMAENADVIMFHLTLRDHPKYKYTDQAWVFLSHEAPCFINIEAHPNLVNWTQSYRYDSDIYMYYGTYCKREKPIPINYGEILKHKSKLVAWFVSNCNDKSRRIDYVKVLLKYINVDIYGGCSHLFGQARSCGSRESCYELLNKSYKFYLSFENSFHTDYITEKYLLMLGLNVVPIVRGDGNYTKFGPPNSFINTNQFKHPKDLATYLLYLNRNDQEYIKYLKYKENYRVDVADPKCDIVYPKQTSYCRICEKINSSNEPRKYYKDIKKWWGKCRTPSDIIEEDLVNITKKTL